MSKAPYFGKVKLLWCISCNVPILGDRCERCNGSLVHIPIAPPGDVRPAFKCDVRLIRKTIDSQFGEHLGDHVIPENKIILLNKTSYIDRMDEIIFDGKIMGYVRFSPLNMKWEFVPKLPIARLLWKFHCKKWVKIDNIAAQAIIDGKNLLAPGILDCDEEILEGDHVIIVNEQDEVVAVGTAKIKGKDMKKREKGLAVKVREAEPPVQDEVLPGGQTWRDVIDANMKFLEDQESKALTFIKNVVKSVNKPVTVAFSGGKDSLATLLLVLKALGPKIKILFIDTGIEFPETVNYTLKFLQQLGLENRLLVKRVSKDVFWRVVEKFGPPGRDYRICCKTNKLGPTTRLIRENFPNGCLTFIGQRKYESERRSKEPKIWRNPWVPGQIGASPIHNWTALQTWLYIFKTRIPYNPLYEIGFFRIGCWVCPALKLAEIENIKKTHPSLWEKWEEELEKWRKTYGFPREWVTYGFWRWRRLSKSQKELVKALGLTCVISETRSVPEILEYTLIYEGETCSVNATESIIKAALNTRIDLERISNFLSILGEAKTSKELGIVNLMGKDFTCRIFQTGRFVIRVKDDKEIPRKIVEKVFKTIVRAIYCVGCGICVSKCPNGAISIINGKAVIDKALCTHCEKCLGECPVLL